MMASDKEMDLTHGDLHRYNVIVGSDEGIDANLDWRESFYSIEQVEFCCSPMAIKMSSSRLISQTFFRDTLTVSISGIIQARR
jgi:aminoglycoside phosphotransferase (APT) family kinase protein